jgi:hypothetical protein
MMRIKLASCWDSSSIVTADFSKLLVSWLCHILEIYPIKYTAPLLQIDGYLPLVLVLVGSRCGNESI